MIAQVERGAPTQPASRNPSNSEREPSVLPPLLVLFGVPLLLLAARRPELPTSAFLERHASLVSLPAEMHNTVAYVLFVPTAALLVVMVRLTLGLQLLGPFRSILLAAAFQVTGVAVGLTFLIATTAIMLAIRPAIRSLRLPYFGRTNVILSIVAVMVVVAVMAADWWHVNVLHTIVYFPIVVLSLIADAFARTANSEGLGSALWKGAMTATVATLLSAMAGLPAVKELLFHNPELLIAQIGGIVLVSRSLDWRLLKRFNPKPTRPAVDIEPPLPQGVEPKPEPKRPDFAVFLDRAGSQALARQ